MAVAMMAPQTADLGSAFDRIAKLEKANRSLTISTYALLVLVLVLTAFAVITSRARPFIQAQGFSLVDQNGNLRGGVITQDGKTAFSITDGNQNARVGMSLDARGTADVIVRDNAGKERLSMSVDGNGNPFFSVVDDRGKIRLITAMNKDNPVINMTNENGASLRHAP